MPLTGELVVVEVQPRQSRKPPQLLRDGAYRREDMHTKKHR